MAKVIGKNVISSNGELPRVSSALVSPVDEFPTPLEETIIVKLDSGRVVEMVIAELSMLYEAGDIPDELTPIAAKALFPMRQGNDQERERDYLERLRLAKWVARQVLRNPDIPVERLYHDEIWQIYSMANNPAEALRNFRRQQARGVAVVPEVQDAEPVAEPASGSDE